MTYLSVTQYAKKTGLKKAELSEALELCGYTKNGMPTGKGLAVGIHRVNGMYGEYTVYPDAIHERPDVRAQLCEKKTAIANAKEAELAELFGDLKSKRILYFDTETTGFSPQKDGLLQFSSIKVARASNGDPLVEIFDTYIRPTEKSWWPQAEAVNHISPAMVRNAPTVRELKEKLLEQFEVDVVVGHNVGFDVRMVEEKLGKSVSNGVRIVDTLKLAKEAFPNEKSYKLEELVPRKVSDADFVRAFKNGAHNSLVDVLGTAKLLNSVGAVFGHEAVEAGVMERVAKAVLCADCNEREML